jgi:hypothetical protein
LERPVITATIGFACIIIGWFVLIPVWHQYATSLLDAAAPLVTIPAYWENITLLAYYLNLLLGISLIGMGCAIDIYILIFAWRREVVQDAIDEGIG